MTLDSGPDLLRAALGARSMSLADLQRKLGCSSGLISRWLAGTRTPGLEYALAMELLFGVPASSWVTAGAQEQPPSANAARPTGTEG